MSAIQYRVTALYERDGRQFEVVGLFNPRHTLRDVWGWAEAQDERLVRLRMVREVRAMDPEHIATAREPMPQLESLTADWGD